MSDHPPARDPASQPRRADNPPPSPRRVRVGRVKLGRDGRPLRRWRAWAAHARNHRRSALLAAAFAAGLILLWLALKRLVRDPPMPSG